MQQFRTVAKFCFKYTIYLSDIYFFWSKSLDDSQINVQCRSNKEISHLCSPPPPQTIPLPPPKKKKKIFPELLEVGGMGREGNVNVIMNTFELKFTSDLVQLPTYVVMASVWTGRMRVLSEVSS